VFLFIFLWSKYSLAYQYPFTKKINVSDIYHGKIIDDPYRWLEDYNSKEVKDWVEKQNDITFEYIKSYSYYIKINHKLKELWNYPKYSVPKKKDNYYFYYYNDGLQNQSILYVKEGLTGEPKILINPNELSKDGTISLNKFEVSNDNKYIAYSISQNGSDYEEIRIRNIETGEDLIDNLKWCKFVGIAWNKDSTGFYYNRFPSDKESKEEERNLDSKIYFHKLGTKQEEDLLIYYDKDKREDSYFPYITDDGKYLFIYSFSSSSNKNKLFFKNLEKDINFFKLFNNEDAEYTVIEVYNDILYLKTSRDAPKGKIVTVNLNNPQKEKFKELILEKEYVLDEAIIIGNHLIVSYLKNANHELYIYDLKGNLKKKIKLPGIGSIVNLSGQKHDNNMFFKFTSFIQPPTIYKYNLKEDNLEVYQKSLAKFNYNNYITEQVFYTSKDGTKIPMFISYKKGLKLDGNNPTILYGYGGFNVSLLPEFSISRAFWMELGCIYVVSNLRGGGEFGEEWHKLGMLDKKQNVFDDFISAAEYLINNKYTNSSKLAIMGGSNGGLLVASVMLQRPDLFGSVICSVPVIDMLRYHKFTVGRYWISEYGNPENKEDFDIIIKYSPLHNIKENTEYPPLLVTTADTDDRVVPSHAYKFIATLQEKYKGKNPMLLRVETKSGHGAGKPTSKLIDEQTDIYSFILKTFNFELEDIK
jgi:prolyl oligopeptidase